MPRHTYILPQNLDAADWSCRGGVGTSENDTDDCFYCPLEIGKMQNCDTRMLALAAHIDEMQALLAMLKDDPLAVLIKKSWDGLTDRLNKELKEAEKQMAIDRDYDEAEEYLAKKNETQNNE